MRTVTRMLVAGAAVATTAEISLANFTYTQTGQVRMLNRIRVRDNTSTFTYSNDLLIQNSDFFNSTLQHHNTTQTTPLNPSSFLGQATVNASATTIASPTVFGYSWSFESFGAASRSELVDPELWLALGSTAANFDLTLTQNARLRFTWDGGFVTGEESNKIENSISVVSGAIVPIFFGLNDLDNVITSAFSFELDLLAGDVISIAVNPSFTPGGGQLEVQSSIDSTGEWNWSQSGSFSIEIIPAPTSAVLVALGGVAAVRRRRAG